MSNGNPLFEEMRMALLLEQTRQNVCFVLKAIQAGDGCFTDERRGEIVEELESAFNTVSSVHELFPESMRRGDNPRAESAGN